MKADDVDVSRICQQFRGLLDGFFGEGLFRFVERVYARLKKTVFCRRGFICYVGGKKIVHSGDFHLHNTMERGLHLRESLIAQLFGEADDGGAADAREPGQFCGILEGSCLVVLQDIVRELLLLVRHLFFFFCNFGEDIIFFWHDAHLL